MPGDRDQAELSAIVKAKATRFAAPADLRQTISAAVTQAAGSAAPRRAAPWRPGWSWLRLATAFVCGVAATALVMQLYLLPGAKASLTDEVLAAHVRSMMVAHLDDIASTDQHTVKPWFAGKLDYSPPVADFTEQGFSLTGGRLDYIDKRTVAALVYHHRGHAINVFVWPIRDGARPQILDASQDGYSLIAWSSAGMQFWIVSDLNAEELHQFSRLVQTRPLVDSLGFLDAGDCYKRRQKSNAGTTLA